jgi:hypothetical protein
MGAPNIGVSSFSNDFLVHTRLSDDDLQENQKGANSVKKRNWIGLGSDSGNWTRGPGDLTAMVSRGNPTGHQGRTRGGGSSGLLGRIQGRAWIRPKAEKEKRKSF